MSTLQESVAPMVAPAQGFTMTGEMYSAGIGNVTDSVTLGGMVRQHEAAALAPEVHDVAACAGSLITPRVEAIVPVGGGKVKVDGATVTSEAFGLPVLHKNTMSTLDGGVVLAEAKAMTIEDLIAAAASNAVAHPVRYDRAALVARVQSTAAERTAHAPEYAAAARAAAIARRTGNVAVVASSAEQTPEIRL